MIRKKIDRNEVLAVLLDAEISRRELSSNNLSSDAIQFSSKDSPFFQALKGLAIAMSEGDGDRAARKRVNQKIEDSVKGMSDDC